MSPPKARDLARWTAEGKRADSIRSKYPELARSYDIYVFCRAQQIVRVEKTTNGGRTTEVEYIPRPVGLAHLPEPGGVLDQPYRLMALFQSFMAGEAMARH